MELVVGAGERRERPYSIHIGEDILSRLAELLPLERYSRIAVVTDEHVADPWLGPTISGLGRDAGACIVRAGEAHKSIETVRSIWDDFRRHELDRDSLVVNLGGGVIGDMGGFAAATYLRGVDFVQVPTTLLAQVDASVGAKVGVNEGGIKNHIGAFARPVAVVTDVAALETLPERELRAGFAEVIKHGLVRDADALEGLRADAAPQELLAVIHRSCDIKREVVMSDEHERGLRRVLNFGHTVGHAVESLALESDAPLLHGEAVSVGMVVAAKLSRGRGYLDDADVTAIVELLASFELPTSLPECCAVDAVVRHAHTDKKRGVDGVRWTLLRAIGEGVIDELVGDDELRPVLEELA